MELVTFILLGVAIGLLFSLVFQRDKEAALINMLFGAAGSLAGGIILGPDGGILHSINWFLPCIAGAASLTLLMRAAGTGTLR
jgi:uncharacterized membrane protein YeaQ/YmgE (transglycosylase-associated protein family)